MAPRRLSVNVVPPPQVRPQPQIGSATKKSSSRERLAKGATSRLPVVVSVRGEVLTVLLDPHTQHTLSWREEIAGLLPPGSCNLFSYPLVTARPVAAKEASQHRDTMTRRIGLARAVAKGITRAATSSSLADALARGRSSNPTGGGGAMPALASTSTSTSTSTGSPIRSSATDAAPSGEAPAAAQCTPDSPRHDRVKFCCDGESVQAAGGGAEKYDGANQLIEARAGALGEAKAELTQPSARSSFAQSASSALGHAFRPPAVLQRTAEAGSLFGFFEELGFSDAFFETAEDANGAWHEEELHKRVLSDEQLELLDELVVAVAMLGVEEAVEPAGEVEDAAAATAAAVTVESPEGGGGSGVGGGKRGSRSQRTSWASVDPFRVPDGSGAFPLHALLISDTPRSVALALRILAARPELVTQAHGPGKFENENALHILAVNRRHEAFADLVAIASRTLDERSLKELLLTQADGSFFRDPPMCDFGGNPVCFACYFGGREAVRALLNNRRTREIIDLNSASLRCRRSGFLPIHAAVAAGDTQMYEYLVKLPGIPGRLERVANPTIKTRPKDPHVHKLTALQLAFWRGDAAMVQYVIEQRSRFQWRWGPLSAIMFSLAEIDSSGAGGNDLMELVIMNDASHSAREMILDGFMDGMLIKLFKDKWCRFARAQHWMLRAIDVVFLALQVAHSLNLKDDPQACDRERLPWMLLLLSLLIASFEVITVVEWVRGRRFSHSSWHAIGSRLAGWAADLHLYRRFAAIVFSAASTLHTILTRSAPHPADGAGDEAAWACLAVGVYFHFSFFIHVLSVPFARLGIFTLVVERLLLTDVPVFLVFFSLYLLNFTATLYTAYPRAGTQQLPLVADLNDPLRALKRMIDMSYAGQSLRVDFAASDADALEGGLMRLSELTAAQQVGFWLFLAFYFLCLVIMSILLLRLFMATLAATFNSTRMAAQLEWRLQFARHVFRAELMHPNCLGTTFCGDEVDGKRMYIKITKSLSEAHEGQGRGPGHAAGASAQFMANDVDGDGKPDFAATQIVENDLDGDGYPDDQAEWDGGGSFTRTCS